MHEDDYRDMVHNACGINPEPVRLPQEIATHAQDGLICGWALKLGFCIFLSKSAR
ncbi:MAG: hypothetical protein ACK50V_00570 [Alphaproteobacteria bacterium]